MRTHRAMKADRATVRRQLANLRTTRIDVRHDNATDVLSVHESYVRQGWDDDEN